MIRTRHLRGAVRTLCLRSRYSETGERLAHDFENNLPRKALCVSLPAGTAADLKRPRLSIQQQCVLLGLARSTSPGPRAQRTCDCSASSNRLYL